MRTLNEKSFCNMLCFFGVICFLFSCHSTQNEGYRIYFSDGVISPNPVLSPDGKRLAFITTSVNYNAKLNIINLQDNSLTTFLQKDAVPTFIAWTSDGLGVVFPASTLGDDFQKNNYLVQMNIQDGETKVISRNYHGNIFLPIVSERNGIIFSEFISKSILVEGKKYQYSKVWHLDKNKTERKITEGLIGLVRWATDESICFVRGSLKGNTLVWNLYLRNLKTRENRLLLKNVLDFDVKGGRLIYFTKQDGQVEVGEILLNDYRRIIIGKRNIEKMSFASIAPSGSKMAFVRNDQISTLDLSSLKENQLTTTKSFKRYPLWTKDEKYIIYSTLNEIFKVESKL